MAPTSESMTHKTLPTEVDLVGPTLEAPPFHLEAEVALRALALLLAVVVLQVQIVE